MGDSENSLIGYTGINTFMLLRKADQIYCKLSHFVHSSAPKQKQISPKSLESTWLNI